MAIETTLHRPGTRVRVVQQIPHTDRVWTNVTEGVITRYQQAKTGSWFAHARDDRLWLDRLELRLDDGEITVFNLDQYTVIESLEPEIEEIDPEAEPESDAADEQGIEAESDESIALETE